jgi:pyruvate/2-oxoglutarate/acetoin dehydrogenase E1 component
LEKSQFHSGFRKRLRAGKDITVVTYGALCQIALEAATLLQRVDIDVEVIDAQSLSPFDRHEDDRPIIKENKPDRFCR